MKKLTGEQLGRLAIHVESTVKEYPGGRLRDGGIPAIPWEHYLAHLIEADPILPSYTEIQKHHSITIILEELISYFLER